MKILMYGWEYPPKNNGGLGVASQGLADALTKKGHDVTFILPKVHESKTRDHLHLVDISDVNEEVLEEMSENEVLDYQEIGTKLMPYLSVKEFKNQEKTKPKSGVSDLQREIDLLKRIELTGDYNQHVMAEMSKYAILSAQLLKNQNYDVIHAHDWMSIKAALIARNILQVPLILHLHSTEFDRNGVFVNPEIQRVEQEGIQKADHIIAVSQRLKDFLINTWQIDESKITVVPNGIKASEFSGKRNPGKKKHIGFVGRLVDQKSPQKFIDIIREIIKVDPDIQVSIAGDGYLKNDLEMKIKKMNLEKHVKLKGFLDRKALKKLYKSLDLLILPSVSEPFGLVALEGISAGVPVIMGENAGILEYVNLKNCEHWDIFNFARTSLELLNNEELKLNYLSECQQQVTNLTWSNPAKMVEAVYQKSLKKIKK